jgi:hypothetical protein
MSYFGDWDIGYCVYEDEESFPLIARASGKEAISNAR